MGPQSVGFGELGAVVLNVAFECTIIVVSDVFLKTVYPVIGYGDARRNHLFKFLMLQASLLLIFAGVLTAWHHTTYILTFVAVVIYIRLVYMWRQHLLRFPEPMNGTQAVSRPIVGHLRKQKIFNEAYVSPQQCTDWNTCVQRPKNGEKNNTSASTLYSKRNLELVNSRKNTSIFKPIGQIGQIGHNIRSSKPNSLLHRVPLVSNRPPAIHKTTDDSTPMDNNSYSMETQDVYILPSTTPPGLMNNGNTCFINSTLECLTWTPKFINLLQEFVPTKNHKESGILGKLHDVILLCNQLPDGKTQFKPIVTAGLLSSISSFAPHLVAPANTTQHQQDAAEFLLWLLNQIHCSLRTHSKGRSLKTSFSEANIKGMRRDKESCMTKIRKIGSHDSKALAEPMMNLSDLDWDLHWNNDSSTLHELFLGQIIEARECQNCKTVTVSIEYFTLLPLPIASSQTSLIECFTKFGEIEMLDLDNKISCSCLEGSFLTPASRLALLSVVPNCLVIQLSRFSYDSTQYCAVKNDALVHFTQRIDLFSYTMKAKLNPGIKESMIYELHAFCVHDGAQSTYFGHYMSYCKAADNQWYHFNDHRVTHIPDIQQIITSVFVLRNAYLLFYHQV